MGKLSIGSFLSNELCEMKKELFKLAIGVGKVYTNSDVSNSISHQEMEDKPMPEYKNIDSTTVEGRRTAERLLTLKFELDKTIPAKTVDPTLLLATWNLREFGGTKSGGREDEPLFYIAEIMSRFDIIAVQEVRDDLDALDKLMCILGGWWKYLVSDVTLGEQGNNERHAYIYDTRKISFGGMAGELVPEMKKDGGVLSSDFAFSRTPYIAGFKAGWFKFTLCTQHFYYGEDKADDPQRASGSKSNCPAIEETHEIQGCLGE